MSNVSRTCDYCPQSGTVETIEGGIHCGETRCRNAYLENRPHLGEASHCPIYDAGEPGFAGSYCKLPAAHDGKHLMASKCPGCQVFLSSAWAVVDHVRMCIKCGLLKMCPDKATTCTRPHIEDVLREEWERQYQQRIREVESERDGVTGQLEALRESYLALSSPSTYCSRCGEGNPLQGAMCGTGGTHDGFIVPRSDNPIVGEPLKKAIEYLNRYHTTEICPPWAEHDVEVQALVDLLRFASTPRLETSTSTDDVAKKRAAPPIVDRPPLTHVACRDTEGRIWSLPRPFRHHHVLSVMHSHGATCAEDGHFSQGFLDESGRYLHRKAAQISAIENGQIKGGKIIGGVLTSEDLW